MQVLEKFKDCELGIALRDNCNQVAIVVTLPDGRRHAVSVTPELTFNDVFEALTEWRDSYEARKTKD